MNNTLLPIVSLAFLSLTCVAQDKETKGEHKSEAGKVTAHSEGLHGYIGFSHEKLHANWPIDRDYMAPPTRGKLVALDPALLVTPPEGLEVGYVPIVTRQTAQ
jgi:hypothetical protein